MHVDSFSGPAASLPKHERTPAHVLECLRAHPRVSCFDMSELSWLRISIAWLEREGSIKRDDAEPYPWVRYIVRGGGESG